MHKVKRAMIRMEAVSQALSKAINAWDRNAIRDRMVSAWHEARQSGYDAKTCASYGHWKAALDAAHDAVVLEENYTRSKAWRTFLSVVQECAADALARKE